ncbi:MAG: hypothetical protein R3B93_16545 [Bacteroidia bacterium]
MLDKGSTNHAVWLTSVHSSRKTTLPLALLWDATPMHTGLAPFGNPFNKRTIFTIQGTHTGYNVHASYRRHGV